MKNIKFLFLALVTLVAGTFTACQEDWTAGPVDSDYFPDGDWYEIPYRCLIPKDMENLLVAGRCISSTHEAQASYRIMPYCAELGQAAGVAAAVAKRNGSSLRDVDVCEVRTLLRERGFAIS